MSGKNFEFPINSSKLIEKLLGIANNPIEAINISLKCINSTVYPFATYANT